MENSPLEVFVAAAAAAAAVAAVADVAVFIGLRISLFFFFSFLSATWIALHDQGYMIIYIAYLSLEGHLQTWTV